MLNIGNSLDHYNLQARLRPALLVLFPAVLTTISHFPDLLQLTKVLIGLAIGCGITLLLSHFSRAFGRKAEARLFAEWVGMPTTHWLSHTGNKLDTQTLTRYHAFLEKQINGWVAPSISDEIENPKQAEVAYTSAVRWLREKTRDREKFYMVFRENISYGFRRNLYGMRYIAIFLVFICLLINSGIMGHAIFCRSVTPDALCFLSFTLNSAALCYWIVVVQAAWVRDAADNYARALIATCDQIGDSQ